MKKFFAFVLALMLIAGAVYSSAFLGRNAFKSNHKRINAQSMECAESEPFASTARGMCTMDGEGRVLFKKDEHKKLAMASTTKIATAITVLDNCTDLDTPFEVDKRAIGIEGTSIYLKKGEKMTVRELLYGLMLRSGNDCATALAYHIGNGDYQKFIDLMNEMARNVGAENTSFANPHGLDEDDHFTTAYDLALISAYAMKNPTFAEIVSTKETKISGVDYPRVIRNKNRLLHGMDCCVGVKTGFTKKAGRCYVGAIKQNDSIVICAVLNCGPMFEEAAELMEDGMEIVNDEFARNAWYNENNVVQ